MDETSWDVVEDLQFLLASDDQLHDELSYVCDLLCDSSDASPSPWDGHDESLSPLGANTRGGAATTTATEHAPKPKPKRIRAKVPTDQTSRARQQREMKELRLQVDRLKRQLVEVSYAQSQRDDASTWERAAHDENRHKNRSIQENDQLRAAVHEHTSLISEMTRVLRKKPRLTPQMDRTSEAWQSCRLAAHKALRVAAIHAIADKQLAMLQTKFIRAGVFDRPDDLIRARPLPQVNGSVIVEYVYHVTLAAPCHLVGDAVWNVFNGSAAAPGDCAGLVDGAVETYEFLDRTTLYRTFTKVRDEAASGRHAVNTAHSNALFKCYKQNDQVAIVWKSVLEDALMPHMTNGAVHDESGWAVVAPITESTCRLTLVLDIVADPVHEGRPSSVDDLVVSATTIIDKLSFMRPPDEHGTFPGAPVEPDALIDMSFAKRTFVERGMYLKLKLKHAINTVVRAHQATDA